MDSWCWSILSKCAQKMFLKADASCSGEQSLVQRMCCSQMCSEGTHGWYKMTQLASASIITWIIITKALKGKIHLLPLRNVINLCQPDRRCDDLRPVWWRGVGTLKSGLEYKGLRPKPDVYCWCWGLWNISPYFTTLLKRWKTLNQCCVGMKECTKQ